MNVKTNTFCLFANRHGIPQNQGALFSEFDFKKFSGVRTENFGKALNLLEDGEDVHLYVTGLTPALTEFLSAAVDTIYFCRNGSLLDTQNVEDCASRKSTGKLFLLHWNAEEGKYIKQVFS